MQENEASSAANRLDRPHGDEIDAPVRAFLIADVRGYTRFTQAQGDEAAAHLAATFAALARDAVAATGGEVVELRGDEALCVFPSARQALRAAVAMQVRFRDRIDDEPVFPLGVGIGVAAGEAVRVEGGYRGSALNLAARLCSLAAGGQILASETVTSLAGTLEGVRFVERRRAKVKGFDAPVRLIEVIPVLELPSVPVAVGSGSRTRRFLAFAIGAALVVGAAVAAFALVVSRHGGGAETAAATLVPDSLAVVDPRTNKPVAQVHFPGRPSLVVGSRRFVWVASDATHTISSVAPGTHAVTHVVAANATPTALAVEGDAVWVLDASRRKLLKIDPGYDEPTRRIALPPAPPLRATNQRLSSLSVSFGAGALWVTDGSSRLLRVDPGSGRIRTLDVHESLDDVVVDGHGVWAISGPAASLFKIDRQARAVTTRIPIVNRLGTTAPYPIAVAAGEGSLWVVNGNTQTVSKIDPQFDSVAATISLGIGRNPSDIATGAGAVWVANGGNGTLARIDPDTNEVTTIPLGNNPTGVAVAGDRVWVSVQPGFRALPIVENTPGAQVQTLPAASCSAVEFPGNGQPRFLIASDLPFQGKTSLAETLQMSDAIRFVLARHRFRAGRYSIGYQSCNDSIASTGSYDAGRCRSNAEAFARTKNVIGLVAGYNSGCVKAQLPVLAGASGGPLILIGSAATYVGLTHPGAGTDAAEPEKYQPGGRRSYARVVVADDFQGAADAMLAKRLGVKRLYVLHDRDLYGFGIAASVRHAAPKLGLKVVGFDSWNAHAHSYDALARRIMRARPDGVFLGGSVDISNGPAVVKDLRAVLGERVRIVLPDGFSPLAAFAHLAGPAAEGITMTLPAPAPQRLRGVGRQFVTDFGKALGRPVEFYSATAAQATEILLDAIARSDGTRASVTSEVFKTKVRNGILGSFSFDRNGDTTAGAVTVYRVVDGKPKLEGLISPSPALVR